jgi:hypothetical protein
MRRCKPLVTGGIARAASGSTAILRVRVWAASTAVDQHARAIRDAIERAGYVMTEKDGPFVCRPPKQHEARIYLAFLPPEPK